LAEEKLADVVSLSGDPVYVDLQFMRDVMGKARVKGGGIACSAPKASLEQRFSGAACR
jgi:hypothetical protein